MSKRGTTTLVNYAVAKENNLTSPIPDILAHCCSPLCLEKLQHESKEQYFQDNGAQLLCLTHRFNPIVLHS